MITIIDYGVGNIGSVCNALAKLSQAYTISDKPEDITNAKGLLLPGVGAAGVGMTNLVDKGLDQAICQAIKNGIPFLGICLGLQLLFESSEEGNASCLGVFQGTVNKFVGDIKVPQIGWNDVTTKGCNNQASWLFDGLPDTFSCYFVNSYYPAPVDPSIIAATSEYGVRFPSIVVKGNVVATQFHPEKSGVVGMKLLQNFFKENNI